jgi:hypothetical protein
MAKATTKSKATVKKKPVKAGSSSPKNVGGVLNSKLVATVKKVKNG